MNLLGAPIFSSPFVEEGVFMVGNDLGCTVYVVGPKTMWSLQHGFGWPGLSRYCRGVLELARDRRCYPRPVKAT